METKQLSMLAMVLRKNGADVLNGISKFTLSLDCLIDLNNSFQVLMEQRDVMNSSFHVVNSSSERVDEFQDMHFLHDFIQKTISLKLTPTSCSLSISKSGDISRFKSLKFLELHNIVLDAVQGIEAVRNQLQSLVCTRNLMDLKAVLIKCGGDNCEDDSIKWEELKEATFTHNHLALIDDLSLSLMPNLHTLDLSHNDLENADALNILTNLKNLNLSYNKLVQVPDFNGTLCNRIQILVLCYNFIENIMSVSCLTNLRELDLSENCIVEHTALAPIANLATLQLLNLGGNPLSYHPQHRSRSTCYLHESTAMVRFLLDGKLLSKSEKQLAGTLHIRLRIRTRTSPNTTVSASNVDKPRRVRNVTITDNEFTPIIERDRSEEFSSPMLVSGEHLDAKRQIEQLKADYGEHWLKMQSGSVVQDLLGIEKSPLSSTPYDSMLESASADESFKIAQEHDEVVTESSEKLENTTQPYVTAGETTQDAQNSTIQPDDVNGLYETAQTSGARSLTSSNEDPDDGELGDGEENIFLATLVNSEESVFIVITDTHIVERESTRSKESSRWPIETLTTCESNENSITVHFDTMRKDAKSRKYEWDNDESPKLLAALRLIIESKPVPETALSLYKCLKCSTQFGIEVTKTLFNDAKERKCPTCSSDLVFEDDS